MAISTYAAQNPPNASANPQYFIQKEILESASTFEVLDIACETFTMPTNSNGFIVMRRYLTPGVDATPAPEGTNKSPRTQIYEDFTGQMFRYTERFQISRQVLALTPFPALKRAKIELQKLITLTRERVRWNAGLTFANKIWNATAVTTNAGVNGPMTPGRIQVITRAILKQRGETFDGIEMGTNKEGTSPLEACLYFFCHTDCQVDIRALPGFIPAASSPTGKAKHKTHFGNFLNVAFFTSQEAPILTGTGVASTTLVNTGGVTDVYQCLVMATRALATVSLAGSGSEGYGNLAITVLDGPDKYDPANMWADVVAAWWDLSMPISYDWGWVYYVGVTLNP